MYRRLFSLLKRFLLLLLIKYLQKWEILLPPISVFDQKYAVIWFYDEKGDKSKVYVPYLRHGSGFEFKFGDMENYVSQHPNIPLLITKESFGLKDNIQVRRTSYDS